MQKAELRKERAQRHGQALEIVARRMRECSAQSADCKARGDETKMFQLNLAWHWLDAVQRDLNGARQARCTFVSDEGTTMDSEQRTRVAKALCKYRTHGRGDRCEWREDGCFCGYWETVRNMTDAAIAALGQRTQEEGG